MAQTIVKIGFTHEKVFHKAGTVVSDEIAQLYSDNVKVVGVQEEVKPVEEKKEVKEEAPVKKATKKKSKK